MYKLEPMTVPGAEIIISSPDNELISVKGGDALLQEQRFVSLMAMQQLEKLELIGQ